MQEYAQKPEQSSSENNSRSSGQPPISEILQAYKNGTLQRMSVDEEELLQAKTRDKSSERETLQLYTEYTHRDKSRYNSFIQGMFDTPQRKGVGNEEPLQGKFDSSSAASESTVQREVKPNNTGLPDNLKSGIENLSGYSMDDVKVHYNSDKPAQLQALAYAQGTDIHVAPGQERHLPHEAWHVVQQKQGRVQPTMQMQGVDVNDNEGLEREADVMGGFALQQKEPMSDFNNVQKTIPAQLIADNRNVFQLTRHYLSHINPELFDPEYENIITLELDEAIGAREFDTSESEKLKLLLKNGKYNEAICELNKSYMIKYKDNYEDEVIMHNNFFGEPEITEAFQCAIKTTELDPKIYNKKRTEILSFLVQKYKHKPLLLIGFNSLVHQVAQDAFLFINNFNNLVGIPHQHSEFAFDLKKRKQGHKELLSITRIYRSMPLFAWEQSKLKGHGGSLGEAMYYFKTQAHSLGAVLVEFTIPNPLGNMINDIQSGGEGGRSSDGKFGGKSEGGSLFGINDKIFSVKFDDISISTIIKSVGVISRIIFHKGGVPSSFSKVGTQWEFGDATPVATTTPATTTMPVATTTPTTTTMPVATTTPTTTTTPVVTTMPVATTTPTTTTTPVVTTMPVATTTPTFEYQPMFNGNYFWHSLLSVIPLAVLERRIEKSKANVCIGGIIMPEHLESLFQALGLSCDLKIFEISNMACLGIKKINAGRFPNVCIAVFCDNKKVLHYAPPKVSLSI